jgi:transcriptional regulator
MQTGVAWVKRLEYGILFGHEARTNRLREYAQASPDVLAVFKGRGVYISPFWFPSKQVDGEIMPTRVYAAVRACGRFCPVEGERWLCNHLESLTECHEAEVSSSSRVSAAPDADLRRLLDKIGGFEIRIERLVGKWKTTVVKPEVNDKGIVSGLERRRTCWAPKAIRSRRFPNHRIPRTAPYQRP